MQLIKNFQGIADQDDGIVGDLLEHNNTCGESFEQIFSIDVAS